MHIKNLVQGLFGYSSLLKGMCKKPIALASINSHLVLYKLATNLIKIQCFSYYVATVTVK